MTEYFYEAEFGAVCECKICGLYSVDDLDDMVEHLEKYHPSIILELIQYGKDQKLLAQKKFLSDNGYDQTFNKLQ